MKLIRANCKIYFIAIILLIFILVSIFAVINPSIHATASAVNDSLYFFNNLIDETNQLFDSNLTIKNIKTLKDFNDNTYLLIECNPTGYLIYDYDINEVLECSATAPSPYTNYSTNLFYSGPQFYYNKKYNGNFVHTIDNRIATTSETLALQQLSIDVKTVLNSTKNNIQANIITNTANIQTRSSTTYVSNHLFFSNLREYEMLGIPSALITGDGVCGYIAANILLGYYDTFRNDNFITIDCMTGSGVNRHFKNSLLTQTLMAISEDLNMDPQNGSTSTEIRKVMNEYFDIYNINASSYDMIVPFFSAITIKNRIDDDKPVILFGALIDPRTSSLVADYVMHAVVIYGYQRNPSSSSHKYGLLAHYGWEGYSNVWINTNMTSIFGSMYNIQSY